MDNLKMFIFSDIHYIDKKPNWNIKRKLFEYAEEIVDEMIYKVNNEIKPDICIHLGDIIQASETKEDDIKNLRYMWKKLSKFNVPFYNLLGNHELKNVKSNKEILDIIGYKNATFSLDIKGYHLLFLGTDVNENDEKYKTQYLSKKDLEFIRKDLEINCDKKIIIFSHFGIAEDEKIQENFYFNKDSEKGMLRNRDELKSLLKGKNVIAVFVGHQHWTKKIDENGISYYMIGSIIENMKLDGIPDGVYFEVETNENDIIVKEKHLKLKNTKN